MSRGKEGDCGIISPPSLKISQLEWADQFSLLSFLIFNILLSFLPSIDHSKIIILSRGLYLTVQTKCEKKTKCSMAVMEHRGSGGPKDGISNRPHLTTEQWLVEKFRSYMMTTLTARPTRHLALCALAPNLTNSRQLAKKENILTSLNKDIKPFDTLNTF